MATLRVPRSMSETWWAWTWARWARGPLRQVVLGAQRLDGAPQGLMDLGQRAPRVGPACQLTNGRLEGLNSRIRLISHRRSTHRPRLPLLQPNRHRPTAMTLTPISIGAPHLPVLVCESSWAFHSSRRT
jgi:hypothetical protein